MSEATGARNTANLAAELTQRTRTALMELAAAMVDSHLPSSTVLSTILKVVDGLKDNQGHFAEMALAAADRERSYEAQLAYGKTGAPQDRQH